MRDWTIRLMGLNCWQAGAAMMPRSRARGLYLLRAVAERDPSIRERARIQVFDVWFADRRRAYQEMVDTDIQVLGLSCEAWSIPWVERLAREAREHHPELILLYGGVSVPLLLQRDRIAWSARDIAFTGLPGRCELPFQQVLAHLVTTGGLPTELLATVPGITWWPSAGAQSHTNPPASYLRLGDRPSPYLDGGMPFDPMADILTVSGITGCPSRCQFCIGSRELQPDLWKEIGFDIPSLSSLGREIDWAVDLGCGHIELRDNALNYDRAYMRRALDRIPCDQVRDLDVTASFLGYDQEVTEILLRQPAGVQHIRFGAQSLSPEACELVGRRHHDLDHIRDAVAPLAGHSRVVIDLMFPLPGGTFDDLQREVTALLQLDSVEVNVNQMAISPPLPFGREPERHGIEVGEIEGLQHAVGCGGFPRGDVDQAMDWLRTLGDRVTVHDSRAWAAHVGIQPGRLEDNAAHSEAATNLETTPTESDSDSASTDSDQRPGSIRLHFEDVSGRLEPSVFFLARQQPGDSFFQRLDEMILWYNSCPTAKLRDAIAAFLLAVIGSMREPLSADNGGQWQRALEEAFSRSPLGSRLRMTVEVA